MTARIIMLCVVLQAIAGCASVEQLYRDHKRYEATERGSEIYQLTESKGATQGSTDTRDSLEAGLRAAGAEMANYRTYRTITNGKEEPFGYIDGEIEILLSQLDALELMLDKKKDIANKVACQTKLAELRKTLRSIRQGKTEAIHKQNAAALQKIADELDDARKQYANIENEIKSPSSSEAYTESLRSEDRTQKSSASLDFPRKAGGKSEIGVIWPENWLNQFSKPCEAGKSCENNTVSGELIRALSSTASIAQMRDLLTEPSFPVMLPVERKVNLGCLPPPDSAAFEAAFKLKAGLQDKTFTPDGKAKADRSATLETEFSSSVVKLFEESERTLFLQYALFRLCEMSVNAPSGFRNVYPVIIHDIVRRTAEMNQVALKETEERKKAEAEAEAARAKAEPDVKKQEVEKIKLDYENKVKDRRRQCVDELRSEDKPSSADLAAKLDEYNKTCVKLE